MRTRRSHTAVLVASLLCLAQGAAPVVAWLAPCADRCADDDDQGRCPPVCPCQCRAPRGVAVEQREVAATVPLLPPAPPAPDASAPPAPDLEPMRHVPKTART